MIITKKCLPRRAVLRGLGATIALPLLDGMVPAFASRRTTAAKPVRRFAAVYIGNGMNMADWTPPGEEALQLSPILQPLAPFRARTTVLSGLDNGPGRSIDAGGLHSRIQPAWLTGTQAKPTEGPDVQAGISLDQIAASALGTETQLPSLELALETVDLERACEPEFSCAYVSTLSWRNATTPLPMEANPRAVFERLFGDGSSAAERNEEMRKDRSILDSLVDEMAALQKQLGPGDRSTVDEYVDTIRDVERRIETAVTTPDPDLPVSISRYSGIPSSFAAHATLMFELLALAYQADLTRVSTFLMVRERSNRVFPESGVPEAIHPLSHHQNDPAKLEMQTRLNTYHLRVFAGLLDKLDATPDGDGSLLDHTTVLFGSGMSNSNLHLPYDVPTLMVGGASAKGGRHVRYPDGTPLTNLQLTLLERLGVPVEQFGNSTGSLSLLSDI